VAAKNIPKAIEDLSAVLAMAAPLHNIKSAARQKLDRMQHSHPTNAAARGIAGTLTTLGMQHSHLTNATSRPNVATAT
jgi:hypothetical protein